MQQAVSAGGGGSGGVGGGMPQSTLRTSLVQGPGYPLRHFCGHGEETWGKKVALLR